MTTADADDAPPSPGSGLAAERARRQGQVDALRAAGGEPYPYRFDRTHTVAEVRAEWPDLEPGTETDDEVTVAGRIVLKRDTGKLVFATIADRGAEIQLFVSKAVIGDDGFAEVKELDRGDWVGVARHGDDDARRRAVGEGRPPRRCSPSRCARCPTSGTACPTPTPASASATSTSSSTPTPAGRSTCATR